MKHKIAGVAATSAALILSATGAFGDDSHFRTPTTDRAQQTRALLSRAADAVIAGAPPTAEGHVANLWVFPTADEDTVFAQYVVTADHPSPNGGVSEEHFELLRLKGNQIVEKRDLTHAEDPS